MDKGLRPLRDILDSLSIEKVIRPQKSIEETDSPRQTPFGVSDPSHTFGNFNKVEGTKAAYQAFWNLATSPDTSPPFLLCYGPVGNGKSYLMEALAIELKKTISVRLWDWTEFLGFLKRMMDNQAESVDTIIERYQSDKGALLLDDVGAEYGTDWEMTTLDRIISGRYRNKAITAMTTNRGLDEVDDRGRRCIPERVLSRFSDTIISRLVLNSGLDYREFDDMKRATQKTGGPS